MNKEFLKKVDLFADLKPDDLDRLYEMTRTKTVQAGEILMTEGDVGDSLYVVEDGQFEVTKSHGDQEVVLGLRNPGEVIGEMALLDDSRRSATVRAITDSNVLVVSQKAFQQVLTCSPLSVIAVLRTFTLRLRNIEHLVVQSDKMAVLGALAADLTHQLNNPASAAQRSSIQLHGKLDEWQELTLQLARLKLTPEEDAKISALREQLNTGGALRVALAPLDRSDRESAVQDWLDEHGMEEAWELGPVLVGFGWDISSLDELDSTFGEDLPLVIRWLVAGLTTYSLLAEVRTGAERISELVKAVKNYSYLDQGPVQYVDITDGLENTLIILKHKVKDQITINRDYAPDLPKIEAYASELNQVWTNIIDNAIDALNGQGEITLRTHAEGDQVVVEISDNGPGIPADVQMHIFERFYTTKGPGVGTGLGMNIAYNIVVDKHHGHIDVESTPGHTTVRVKLPVKLARE